MSFVETVAEWFAFLPPPLVVAVIGFSPVLELRGALPLAIFVYKMPWPAALFWSLLGNLLAIPVVWFLLPRVERILRKSERLGRMLDRIYARTRRRASKHIERYEEVGLFLFVALPLPGTGAWTGVLAAYLFGLPRTKAWIAIGFGVFAAAAVATALIATGTFLFLL